jgi:hypothetical protein
VKSSSPIKDNLFTLLIVAALGLLGVDTLYRLFVKRPAAGAAETTVSLAVGKARPWSTEEQQTLSRVLPPCRQQALDGKVTDMVNCWVEEARKTPNAGDKSGQSDTAVLAALLDRAGYKR